jgi:hypothetical protein
MHKRQGELYRARNPQRYRSGRAFPRVRIENARSHVRLDERGGLIIISKAQAPHNDAGLVSHVAPIVTPASGAHGRQYVDG